MNSWVWELSECQREAIRFIYSQREGEIFTYAQREAVIGRTGLSATEYESLMTRLAELRFVRPVELDGFAFPAVQGRPELASVIQTLENPPPKDYWKTLTIWFKSKWWSIPVFVVTVILPAVWGYIEVSQKIIKYFSGEGE